MKRSVIAASYMIYNIAVSTIICVIVLALAFVYLAATGWYLSVADVFAAIGMTLLSVISASVIATAACVTIIKTEGAHSGLVGILSAAIGFLIGAYMPGLVGILSAAIGFLIGAYMPVSTFPKAVQYVTLFLPGTYSAGVFRSIFMEGAISELEKLSPFAAESVREAYSVNIDFFGKSAGVDAIAAIFAAIVAFSFLAYMLTQFVKVKRNTFFTFK